MSLLLDLMLMVAWAMPGARPLAEKECDRKERVTLEAALKTESALIPYYWASGQVLLV